MERFFTGVLVVNATSAGERLRPVIARLKQVGYFDVCRAVEPLEPWEGSCAAVDGLHGAAHTNCGVPLRLDGGMEFATTVEFAHAARRLTRSAGQCGLVAPSYRCPPRLVGVDRTIRRRTDAEGGGAVVSVRVQGRPQAAVLADMIEGVVITNRLVAPEADQLRNELWAHVESSAVHTRSVDRGAA